MAGRVPALASLLDVTAPKLADQLLKRPWTAAEDALLRELYPTAARAELRAALSKRSDSAIGRRAHELGVKRSTNPGNTGNVVSPVIVRDGVAGKACVKCLAWLPLEKFARHKGCAGGRRNTCTTCEGRQAYATSRAKKIAAVRRWQDAHPAESRIHRQAARARRYLREKGGKVTAAEIAALFVQYDHKCAYCGTAKADSIDHVVPLARGGAHAIENLLPACLDCNRSKHAKSLDEWKGRKCPSL